jgi:DNA-directed RNA polymerase specialized sigma24 family protein
MAESVRAYVLTGDAHILGVAFTGIRDRLRTVIYRHVQVRCGIKTPSHLLDDLVQEAFLKSKIGIDDGHLRTLSNVDAWCAQIARNTAMSYLKKNQRY